MSFEFWVERPECILWDTPDWAVTQTNQSVFPFVRTQSSHALRCHQAYTPTGSRHRCGTLDALSSRQLMGD